MLLSAPARRRSALTSLFTPSAFLLACAALYPVGTLAQDEAQDAEVVESSAESFAAEEAAATPPEETAVADEAAVTEETAVSDVLAAEPTDSSDDISEVIAVEALETTPTEPETLQVAEDGDAVELEAVQVTGSRLRRTDFETAQPVLVINRDDIERTGLTSLGDILQNLPQAGSAINTQLNNGGDGSTEIDLRNLGSNRVLVLVNGRRWVGGISQLRTGSVDLNTIPLSIVDSIEVLKDGASAIYGSDAIAGVVNIKTRRDFEGAEVRGQYQLTGQNDGQGYTTSFAAGTVDSKSSVFLDISYTETDALFAGDRRKASVPTFGIPDISRGSTFSDPARLIFVPTPGNANVISQGNTDPTDPASLCYDISSLVTGGVIADPVGDGSVPGLPIPPPSVPIGAALNICNLATVVGADGSVSYKPFDVNTDQYNFAPINYLLTPSERTGIYSQFSRTLTDSVRLSGEILYNLRRSQQLLAETPIAVGDLFAGLPFGLAYVDATNPFNPTNPQSPYYIPGTVAQDIGRGDPGSGLVGLGGVLRRMRELGPRVFTQNVDTMRVGGGLEGQLDLSGRFFAWDAGLAYNETRSVDENAGLINMQRMARAVGPLSECVDTDATTAPAVAEGCVPFDLFGPFNSITPEMLDYVAYTAIDTARSRQTFVYANGSTDFPEATAFLAGPLGVAFGAEYRKESYRGQPDATKIQNISSTNSETATNGSYDVHEAFVELGIPLLADLPFVQSLNLSVAGRYSSYEILDKTFDKTVGKLGIEYRPLDELLVRGTASQAFRAPSITDLFLGAATSFPEVVDPCSDYTNSENENVQTNCAADGVPSGYSQVNAQVPSVFGGNPDLQPESADTLAAGLVWSPSFLRDFNISVDWYNVEITDIISFPGAGQVLGLCYAAAPDQRSLCEFVQRGPTGELERVDNRAANLGGLEVEGVDFNFDYRLPFTDFGTFRIEFDGAYVTKYDTIDRTPDGEVVNGLVGLSFGGLGAIPRFKANAGLIWSLENWSASWSTRYIYQLVEGCDDGRQDPGRAVQPGILANPTPVQSLEGYGLCSGEFSERFQIVLNKVDDIFYHDVQVGYELPSYGTSLTVGINNLFDTDPPELRTAFSSSYDPTLYDYEGSQTYFVKFIQRF